MSPSVRALALLALLASACASSSKADPTPVASEGSSEPAPQVDAGDPATPDASDSGAGLSGKCADTFGSALTAGTGRLDGIVYAVQKPSDTQCVMPNSDHVVLQVLMNAAVYRMVVNVKSDRQDQDVRVRFLAMPHALPAPPFAEGWHLGAPLDYPALDAHNAAFAPLEMDALVAKIASLVRVGDKVAVYAESGQGRPESAHKIHRNAAGKARDGAIVVSPDSASPTFLLFHFDGQTF